MLYRPCLHMSMCLRELRSGVNHMNKHACMCFGSSECAWVQNLTESGKILERSKATLNSAGIAVEMAPTPPVDSLQLVWRIAPLVIVLTVVRLRLRLRLLWTHDKAWPVVWSGSYIQTVVPCVWPRPPSRRWAILRVFVPVRLPCVT